MSAGPQAILYYGIDLGGAMKEKYMTATYDYHAINEAWHEEHQPKQPEGDPGNYKGPAWDEWRKQKREFDKSPEHVAMNWFGAESCERFVVHCPGLKISVEWDKQHEFERGHLLGPDPEADKWIEAFCVQFGLPFKRPSWHLAALYF